jgi:hypothetical protein
MQSGQKKTGLSLYASLSYVVYWRLDPLKSTPDTEVTPHQTHRSESLQVVVSML